jgi:hypothetical protein
MNLELARPFAMLRAILMTNSTLFVSPNPALSAFGLCAQILIPR